MATTEITSIICTFCPNIMSPVSASQWQQIDVDMFVCPQCAKGVMGQVTKDPNFEVYQAEDNERAENYYGSHYQHVDKAIKKPR